MKIIITACAAMLLFFSCTKNQGKKSLAKMDITQLEKPGSSSADKKKEDFFDYETDSTGTPPDITGEKQKQPVKSTTSTIDWDKKIIKTANISFEVKDFRVYSNALLAKVKNAGGYIAQEQQNQGDYKIETNITIKVPVGQFDGAVAALTADVEKINEKNISSEDVTGEYVDTRSRIEAKKQVRQRYMELLGQARNMEDILSVQSEINEIQEQIESANGRINYLGHASAFSTIHLTYFQVLNASAKDNVKPSFGTEVGRAFKTGWGWITDLFVGLVSVWPLILGISLVVIYLKRMKWNKSRQAA